MQDPVAEIEGDVHSIKVAVLKGKEVLVFGFEALNRVRLAFREVPDVAEAKLFDLVLAVFVDGGDEHGAGIDKAPFSLKSASMLDVVVNIFIATYHFVPMHFSYSTSFQVLLGACNVMTLW